MRTACPACRAPVIARTPWTEEPKGFRETYSCGAVYAWGEDPRVVVRCPAIPSRSTKEYP